MNDGMRERLLPYGMVAVVLNPSRFTIRNIGRQIRQLLRIFLQGVASLVVFIVFVAV